MVQGVGWGGYFIIAGHPVCLSLSLVQEIRSRVTGGMDGKVYLDEVLRYDGIKDTWTAAGTLASARTNHAMATMSGDITEFCTGEVDGESGGEKLDDTGIKETTPGT